jgi:hypothetical protein
MARTKTTTSRGSKGVRSAEPLSDVNFEDEAEAMDQLRDGMSMLPGTGAYRTRPLGMSSDGDYAGVDD